MFCKANDINEALARGLQHLLLEGVREDSRNGPVLVAPGPVCIEYTEPRNRVLYSTTRDANPVFHFMESLWMLAGSNDIEFPCFFNKSYAQFSDDGSTMWDAYGWRWRRFFGYDQLEAIVEELRASPTSRRCVLSMWNSEPRQARIANQGVQHPSGRSREDDFWIATHGGKAVPCLGGETVLKSPEGSETLKELADQFKSGSICRWPVFSFNVENKQQSIAWCTRVWRSGKRRLYKLRFYDGSVVRATADHRFFRKKFKDSASCEEVTVKELHSGDRVWASSVWEGSKGHLFFSRSLAERRGFHNELAVSRAYYELCEGPIPPKHVVHHKDEQKQNNRRANLDCLLKSNHDSIHRVGDRNPMRKMSSIQRKAKGRRHSSILKADWAARTAEERSAHREHTSEGLRRSWARLSPKERSVRAQNLSEASKLSKSQKLSESKRAYWTAVHNHVLLSIEPDGYEDVYDFEVPVNHNAMLENGVFTHNCNSHAYFAIRNDKLNMTVMNRSNDAIWGAFGANAVHFSFLLEYMAMRIGVPMGSYFQFTNNLHTYTDKFSIEKLTQIEHECDTVGALTELGPAIEEGFDEDLHLFMPWALRVIRSQGAVCASEGYHVYDLDAPVLDVPGCKTTFFHAVAIPMFLFWVYRKWKDEYSSNVCLAGIDAPDWQRACQEWVDRRSRREL